MSLSSLTGLKRISPGGARPTPRLSARVDALIVDIRRSPFAGIGKPEPLKHEWQGYWSRRITAEHRLVYRVEAGRLYILQARYHY